jgi:hypothetical protein
MNGFSELIKAYIADHPNILPPSDDDGRLAIERDGLDWQVSVRNGGEIFSVVISTWANCSRLTPAGVFRSFSLGMTPTASLKNSLMRC